MLADRRTGQHGFLAFSDLIVLNAVSIPPAMPQIVLNLSFSVFYLGAAILSSEHRPGETLPMYVPGISLQHAPAETNTVAGQAHSESDQRRTIHWDSTVPLSRRKSSPRNHLSAPVRAAAADALLLRRAGACWNGSAASSRRRANLPRAKASCIPPAGWPPNSRIRSKIRSPSSTTPPFAATLPARKQKFRRATNRNHPGGSRARRPGHHANHGLRAIERRPRGKTERDRGTGTRHRAGFSARRARRNQNSARIMRTTFRRC